MLNSADSPKASARPVAIAKARRRPPVATPEAMTAGRTGRMHGVTMVSRPATKPITSSNGLISQAFSCSMAVRTPTPCVRRL